MFNNIEWTSFFIGYASAAVTVVVVIIAAIVYAFISNCFWQR